MRVSVAIQFTSQVLPPSGEKDCSKRQEFGVTFDQTFRTKTLRPLKGSVSKNSPRPFLNSPMVGTLIVPDSAAGCIEAPLMGLRVVQPQRKHFQMPRRAVRLQFSQVRASIPNLVHYRRTLVLRPGGRAREWMLQATHVCLPRANVEVEILLPIAHCRGAKCRIALSQKYRRRARQN